MVTLACTHITVVLQFFSCQPYWKMTINYLDTIIAILVVVLGKFIAHWDNKISFTNLSIFIYSIPFLAITVFSFYNLYLVSLSFTNKIASSAGYAKKEPVDKGKMVAETSTTPKFFHFTQTSSRRRKNFKLICLIALY